MGVQAFVDAWWNRRPWFNGRQVQGGFETIAGQMGAGIGSGNFLLGLQGAGALARLSEQRAGQLSQGLGEGLAVRRQQREERLFDGAVHVGDNRLEAKGLFLRIQNVSHFIRIKVDVNVADFRVL